jgi:hypothetical protein
MATTVAGGRWGRREGNREWWGGLVVVQGDVVGGDWQTKMRSTHHASKQGIALAVHQSRDCTHRPAPHRAQRAHSASAVEVHDHGFQVFNFVGAQCHVLAIRAPRPLCRSVVRWWNACDNTGVTGYGRTYRKLKCQYRDDGGYQQCHCLIGVSLAAAVAVAVQHTRQQVAICTGWHKAAAFNLHSLLVHLQTTHAGRKVQQCTQAARAALSN